MMAHEEGFYLKMRGYIDSMKAGVLTLEEFSSHIDNAYAHKQQGKVEILEICKSPEYLEHVAPAIAALLAKNPDLDVELSLATAAVDLVKGKFDLAVRIGDSTFALRRAEAACIEVCREMSSEGGAQ